MSKIKMQNVRTCFINFFRTATFAGEDTGKYDGTFILDKEKHAALIALIIAAMEQIAKEKFKGKMLPDDRLCLKDGDESEREEYQGAYTIKASSKKRPLVLNRDKTPLTEEDNVIYAGCYVNAIISLWGQDNQYGKRINAQLDGVMFNHDGEPLGGGGLDVNEFDAFETEEEEMPF